MRNIVGLDLNGWHDHAARDWLPYDGEFATNGESAAAVQGSDGVYCLDGGTAAVVVEFGEGGFVAGPQATFSPIGRGAGWGTIGRLVRRRKIAALVEDLVRGEISDQFGPQMRAAVDAMSVSAEEVVLVVPDRPEVDDERRETLLRHLEGPRRPFVRLLWRPIAITLSILESGSFPAAREGLRVLCLDHSDEGIERQTLLLRELSEHPGVFAPERAGYGHVICRSVGLSNLLAESERQTAVINRHLEDARHEPSRLPARLLVEGVLPGTSEILRLDNGTWIEARAPELSQPPCLRGALDLGPFEADVVVLTTPLAEPWRQEFIDRIAGAVGASALFVAPPISAAHGALVAGRRIERDIPHYLDHLEQISLIASRDGELGPVDLMPVNAAVPANREYVSDPIRSLSWPARVKSVDFYIRKSGEFRKWRTPEIRPPEENQQIEICLRQMPAQGRARLSATSTTWSTLRASPIFLDWANLTVDPRTLEEIVLALQPPPKFPDRLMVRTHLDVWKGDQPFRTVSQILRDVSKIQPATLDSVSSALRRNYRIRIDPPFAAFATFENFHALDFDGTPPEGVDAEVVAKLDWFLKEIADRILLDCSRKRRAESNKPLIVVTWAYGRCPASLQDEMLKALAARLAGRDHPLLAPVQSEKVLVHGLGRTVTDAKRMVTLLNLVAPNVSRPFCLAALSSVLSRTQLAPLVLTEDQVSLIAKGLAKVLANLRDRRSFAVNLKYAMLAIGGLLRVREREPFALLTSRSAVAAELARPLRDIVDILKRTSGHVARSEEKAKVANNLLAMLDGEGGDVGVLVDAESLDESDDEG